MTNAQAALQAAATVHASAAGYASPPAVLALAERFEAWLEADR